MNRLSVAVTACALLAVTGGLVAPPLTRDPDTTHLGKRRKRGRGRGVADPRANLRRFKDRRGVEYEMDGNGTVRRVDPIPTTPKETEHGRAE